MSKLTIDLQNGFDDEAILIKVNGDEAFRATDVTTRYQIGLARSVELEATEDQSVIEIVLPDKRLSKSIDVDTSSAVYVGISLTSQHEIAHRVSAGPFLYA